MTEHKWFTEIKTDIPNEQGIILEDFEWFDFNRLDSLRDENGSAKEISTLKNHVVILTQSCDLIKQSTKFVHVCPVYSLADYFLSQGKRSLEEKKELYDSLTRNAIISKHLLNTYDLETPAALKNDYIVADFGKAVVVPMAYIKNFMTISAKDSFPMINIPYRESLAQRYGNFFSRVGNPLNLDEFENSIHSTPQEDQA